MKDWLYDILNVVPKDEYNTLLEEYKIAMDDYKNLKEDKAFLELRLKAASNSIDKYRTDKLWNVNGTMKPLNAWLRTKSFEDTYNWMKDNNLLLIPTTNEPIKELTLRNLAMLRPLLNTKDNYTPEIRETWYTPMELINASFKGDCLKKDTKLLMNDLSLREIKDITIGDEIIGKDGEKVKVLNKIFKGVRPLKKITLSNGSSVFATEDHKFILENNEEVPAKVLEVGDVLKSISKINTTNKEKENQDYWYLKGLFIADGWYDKTKPKSIFISGKDGHPKEEQKKWIKNYCEKNNIKYSWHERYIGVHSEELANDFKNCGDGAINKKVGKYPCLDVNIESLISGLKADSHTNKNGSVCFGTISNALKQDILNLYKLLGISCYTKKVEPTRTQYGKNPIWRIYPRLYKPRKHKIISIVDYEEDEVYDITVENHEIYLPENDIVVHNCDDVATFLYFTLACQYYHNNLWESFGKDNLFFAIGSAIEKTWWSMGNHAYIILRYQDDFYLIETTGDYQHFDKLLFDDTKCFPFNGYPMPVRMSNYDENFEKPVLLPNF